MRKIVSHVQQVAVRSLVIFVMGLVWFLATPWVFIWGLPQFQVYNQLLVNYGTTIADVYQFWTVIPEIMLFFFGIFWAGGLFETITRHIQ